MPWAVQLPYPWNHCPACGERLTLEHDGEQERPYCSGCRRFYYSNPVPAVCCIVVKDGALLLARRAVEPCIGAWSLPGGFVELGETTEEAALRELKEETNLEGEGLRLVGASTKASAQSGGVIVLGYSVAAWRGVPRPATDATDVRFFAPRERPPLAFEAHRELLGLYTVQTGSERA